jgi:hypothetical protein
MSHPVPLVTNHHLQFPRAPEGIRALTSALPFIPLSWLKNLPPCEPLAARLACCVQDVDALRHLGSVLEREVIPPQRVQCLTGCPFTR